MKHMYMTIQILKKVHYYNLIGGVGAERESRYGAGRPSRD